jgi:FlaA1/EpsC-like NDP-sugar epimerase
MTIPVAYFLAFILRFNFNYSAAISSMSIYHFVIIFPVFMFYFWKSKSYTGVLRHSNTEDINRIFEVMFFTGVFLVLIVLAFRIFNSQYLPILPLSVIIIMNLIASAVLIFSRLLAKTIFLQIKKDRLATRKIMIFGAGKLGQMTRSVLLLDTSGNTEVIGFVDDNIALNDRKIFDLPIYSVSKAFNKIIPENNVTELIFAVGKSNISLRRKREITDKCLESHLVVKEVMPIENWINGELQAHNIRKINILDLLGRDAIQLNHEKIEAGLKNSVVLVAGAAGSIGSEIVRQLIAFNVKQVILLDKAESDLYNLQDEIKTKNAKIDFDIIVGDVTNKNKLRKIFLKYAPTMVINAAAYKHVPLMERFPCEAIRVNVGGTKNLADLAVESGVEKFVYISTDKAVNPTNIMGASKRLGEIYIQSLMQSKEITTRFITTRFGNVLGSSGSVVPLFEKQIERGGPVTVTHKDITRYFMTIPEASQLVLEAGFMGNGGEIFVFDMGEPVKIYLLAEKMISLSGFVPNRDIEIKITGLRPGEKLYEELLDNSEELMPTYNDKIFIGKVRKHEYKIVNQKISTMLGMLDNIDEDNCELLVKQIKNLVPEFSPNNSCYGYIIKRAAPSGLIPEPIIN